nr:hypothetical protein [uncultured Carboxylicivirga sp.]
MKKIVLMMAVGVFINLSLRAQVSTQEVNLMKSILKSEVKVFFAQNMKLKTTEVNQFWEIYDMYEAELLPIGNHRIEILRKIVGEKGALNESDIDNLIREASKLDKQRSKVRNKYYNLCKKKLNIGIAAQFYQLDVYIRTQIAAAIMEGSPLVVSSKN